MPRYKTTMNWLLVAKLLLLLAAANGTPVLAKTIFGDTLSHPLDRGVLFPDGRPWLGPSKTIRGILLSLIVTSVVALVLGLPLQVGFVVALVAMAGDLLSSFTKRRLGLVSSSMALGIDQIPESLLPLLALRAFLSISFVEIVLVVLLFFVFELALSRLAFRLHLKNRPY